MVPCLRSLALGLSLFACPGAGTADRYLDVASEIDYVEVARFPPIMGVPSAPASHFDPATGVVVVKKIYLTVSGSTEVRSHAVETYCGGDAPLPGERMLLILAVQVRPLEAVTARGADLRNRFAVAYVRDEDGRIRLYTDLTVVQLTGLTRRFLPQCPIT